MKRHTAPEILETRIALNGSAIAKALGVPAGGTVLDYSQAAAIAVGSNFGVNGLLGFPTGPDDQFVVISTGDATKFNTPGYSKHGTDWTSKGPPGDDVSMDFSLPVPVGAKRLKLDFIMLTHEEPNSGFPDLFKITANAGMGGGTETLVDYTVDNVFFVAGAETGPNFTHRTLLLTMNYQVPVGASNISLHMELGDKNDGTGDTAVIMDNLRFEQSGHLVYLNFEGGTTGGLGPGTTLTMPAFQVSDLGYAGGTDRATIINEIVSEVQGKYSAFDVSFVTTQPASGDYTTVLIGGSKNNPVALGAGANPFLLKKYPSGTTYAAISNLDSDTTPFGEALGGSLDIGNKKLNDVTVVFPQSFQSFYFSDSAATREDRMVVTIAHELGHALGLRHIASSNDNDPNIMKQRSPRSSTAGFENVTRDLPADELILWVDKATQQNDAAYLRSVLGSANGSDVELGISPLAFTKYVTALTSLIFGGSLYNAYLGVIPGQPLDSDGAATAVLPEIFKIGDLTGDQLLQIPITSFADKIVFWGQSTPNGPVDVFSGQQTGGTLDFNDSGVPLFDSNGNLNLSIPTAFGDPNAGPLTDGPNLGLKQSDFRIALLPFGTYEDTPPIGATHGDSYTIKLTSKTGTGGFTMIDPDGDGKGAIGQIVFQDTTIKDKLSVTVKKPSKADALAGFDGRVDISAITGPILAGIDAKASNLVGTGIDIGNQLGSLTVRDILNGADITLGGGEFVKTSITAHDVGDGSDIVSRSSISKLTLARIGNGTIDAPTMGTLSVKGDKAAGITGDFRATVKLSHSSPFLTTAIVKKNVLGSATITGGVAEANFDIDGSVGSFKAGRFVDSIFDARSFLAPAKLGSFTVTGIKGITAPSFGSSNVIANIIGSAKLGTIATTSPGGPFGITATDSIGSVTGLLPGDVPFKYDKKNANVQGTGDFYVQVI